MDSMPNSTPERRPRTPKKGPKGATEVESKKLANGHTMHIYVVRKPGKGKKQSGVRKGT